MPRDTWSKWHWIYSVNLILYKSSDLKPLSPPELLGEFAKNRFGKNFPVAVLVDWDQSFRLLFGPPNSTDYLLLLQIFSGVD